MYHQSSKRKKFIRRILVYAVMVITILIIVTGMVFIILGYRLDSQNGTVEQGALMQFNSDPSGANVTIDGKTVNGQTSTKSSVTAGVHMFAMQKTGYEPWTKTLDIKAGTLTWLDYTRLVPKNRPVTSVASYSTVYASKASPDNRFMIIQQKADTPTFDLVDLTGDTIKSTSISIPEKAYSDAGTDGITHTFSISEWDSDGRYVLIQHTHNDQKEWIVFDTQNPDDSQNVTTLLDIGFSSLHFSGTSGSVLYGITDGDLRKIDLSAATISKAYVSHVTSFDIFNSNIITYVGVDGSDSAKRVVGVYKDGDSAAHTLQTTTDDASVPLTIATTNYFNNDYVAISDGTKVVITSGSYPSSNSTNNNSLKPFASFNLTFSPTKLSFSVNGDYLLMQSGTSFASYDIEHQTLASSTTATVSSSTTTSTAMGTIDWLDDAHLWSDMNGNLTMRDFDGTNTYTINPVATGQGVTLTQNDRYIYSIGTSSSGYQLQRVRLILP